MELPPTRSASPADVAALGACLGGTWLLEVPRGGHGTVLRRRPLSDPLVLLGGSFARVGPGSGIAGVGGTHHEPTCLTALLVPNVSLTP